MLDGRRVVDQDGLGHLEHQPVRREPGGGERSCDVVDDPAVGEVPAERLTAIVTWSAAPPAAARQAASWRVAVPSTQRSRSQTSRLASATGMNSSGGTSPRPGRFQRTSASYPAISADPTSITGW